MCGGIMWGLWAGPISGFLRARRVVGTWYFVTSVVITLRASGLRTGDGDRDANTAHTRDPESVHRRRHIGMTSACSMVNIYK